MSTCTWYGVVLAGQVDGKMPGDGVVDENGVDGFVVDIVAPVAFIGDDCVDVDVGIDDICLFDDDDGVLVVTNVSFSNTHVDPLNT